MSTQPWQDAFHHVVAEFFGRQRDGSYTLPGAWDRRDTLPVSVLLELESYGVAQMFLNASYVEILEEMLVLIVRNEALRLTRYAIENGRRDLTIGGA